MVRRSVNWLVAFPIYVDIYSLRSATNEQLSAMGCMCQSLAMNVNVSNMCQCSEAIACAAEWNIAATFELFCVDEVVLRLPPTFVILGILIGALAGGSLSDRFGRRPTLIASLALQVLASIFAAAAPSYHFYLVSRLVCGIGMSGVTQAGYTLATEIVGPRYRTVLTTELWAYQWAAMSCLLALLAYLLQSESWRAFQLALAAPSALLWVVVVILVPESPRWLEAQGQHKTASSVLKMLLGGVPLLERPQNVSDGGDGGGGSSGSNGIASAALPPTPTSRCASRCASVGIGPAYTLFSSYGVLRVTLAEMFVWGSCTLAFYGVQFNAVNLDPDHFYLNEMLVALPQIPATFACARFMDHPKVGRCLAVTLMLGAVAVSLATAACLPQTGVVCSMIASFMATGAFNTVYVQVSELFPTSVRNSALGLCSAWARVTSVTSSLLPSILGSRGSLACIAIVCALASALCWLEVPETVGRGLPEELPSINRSARCCGRASENAAERRVDQHDPGTHANECI